MRIIIYLEQYAKNLLNMSNWMCGKFSASVQLHGHSFMVNISNSGGDIAYIFITEKNKLIYANFLRFV